jgi:IS5 family transposase
VRDHRRGQRPGEKGGPLTGPNPVDRGKAGSKIHVISDDAGLPLAVAISAANTNDCLALRPLVMGIPAIRSRRGPRHRKPAKLRADKGYDFDADRRWLHSRGIIPRIARRCRCDRRGIDTSERLGRHRWKIERTIAWSTGYRRLVSQVT